MKPAAVGIDVGGTKCLGIAIDHDGRVLDELKVPTPTLDADQLIATLASIAEQLDAPGSVGLGVPGLVNRAGVLLKAPNVTAGLMLPLRERLGQASGLHVVVDNDNTVACLAEWRLGAGRGSDDMVLIGIGTGIGGGYVAGGALQRGHNGFAGEAGHMIVKPNGLQCPCGQRGCWERYASGSGLGHLARNAARAGNLAGILATVGDIASIRGEHVTAAAERRDPEALAVVDTFAGWVALGLVNLTNLFDPELFVLSGGISADADLFLPPIQAAFESMLFASDLRPRPELRFAELGPLAGGIGAALLTMP
ncbi:MAG: ROK family protein [Actinobacteria bacterium]|nr:ROK family protein [Actinomycetota bacterium]